MTADTKARKIPLLFDFTEINMSSIDLADNILCASAERIVLSSFTVAGFKTSWHHIIYLKIIL